jgi:HK97 family phage portal protein
MGLVQQLRKVAGALRSGFKANVGDMFWEAFFLRPGAGAFQSWQFREAVASGYHASVWVNRCIGKIAESVSSVPWKAQTDADGDGTYVDEASHPLQRLIDRPNPYSDRREFLTQLVQNLMLAGNAYIEIVRDRGIPVHLYHMRPDWVRPVTDPEGYLAGYEWRVPGRRPVPMALEEVIHFKFVDPLNPHIGCSPLAAAAKTLQSEDSILKWNKGILDNSAVPGGILYVPSSNLLREDREQIREELISEFGGARKHRPMVLWGDMKWQTTSLNHKDLDFLEQRRINKYEICAIFGVPPQLVGANEDPTYSNYEIARLSFWEDVVVPMLDWFQTRFNAVLAPSYGLGAGLRLVYDVSDTPAMRASYEQKVKTAEVLWRMGWPINEINRKLNLGLALVPWGETAWISSSLVPAGALAPTPPEGDETEDQDGLV